MKQRLKTKPQKNKPAGNVTPRVKRPVRPKTARANFAAPNKMPAKKKKTLEKRLKMLAAQQNGPNAAPIKTRPKMPKKLPVPRNAPLNAKRGMPSGGQEIRHAAPATHNVTPINGHAMQPATLNAAPKTHAAQKNAAAKKAIPAQAHLSLPFRSAQPSQDHPVAEQAHRRQAQARAAAEQALRGGH